MERKLASIQRINSLRPIEGADAIEMAEVLGWRVVVKKGEFQEGDLCVYCEVDSVLPDQPEYEFLRDRKFRIKTIKLRGQISQGICFPLHRVGVEGEDVTEELGIIKFEPPIAPCLRGLVRGNFPGWLRKTDEERIQSLDRVIFDRPDAHDPVWYVTEKLDGTSFTAAKRLTIDGTIEFHICSRNMDFKLEDCNNLYVQVGRELEDRLPEGFAVQGEILAPGVQKNKYQVTAPCLRIFSLFNITEFHYEPLEVMEQMVKYMGLETVPIIDRAFALPATVDDLVQYSIAPSSFQPKLAQREGVVIRNVNDSNVSFKVINPKFLLKWDE